MEEASQQGQRDRITSTSTSPLAATGGGRPLEPNFTELTLPPKEERIVSANPSPGAVMTVPSPDIPDHLESSYSSGGFTTLYPQQQTYFYGGFENNTGSWDDYSRYVNANGLQVVPPGIYNDNSLLYHPGYGIDTQMAYGQFSPMASPLSPIMVDGQLYSPHHVPMSPSYFPQPVSPGVPNVNSSHQISQSDMVAAGGAGQEGIGDNGLFGPGSGYVVQFGSFGGGNEALTNRSNTETGNYLSPLAQSNVYPQPIGILGPYDHNAGQLNQQMPSHGYGLVTSPAARSYPQGGSYQSSNYNTASMSRWGANNRSQFNLDKGGRRDRDRESVYVPVSPHGIPNDRNRGPRASKPKGKSSTEESSSSGTSKVVPVSGADLPHNQPDFVTDYENAKFFIIKSFSEDNVHKSIKYNVWASTPLGNRKLDAAYSDSKDVKGQCPIFLFFSVNASGQFCGVAEMIGPVDFENDADYWQQDRWSGQFPVKWHILKDVPNSRFRHILLQNNENKPVTHSRDSQEVNLEQGIEMLKIFKDYDAETTILDDFNFYDEREKALQERKARQQAASVKNASAAAADALADNFGESLQLDASAGKEVPKTE